jgi:phenylacetic acid degradation operon negative regulatory protein
MDGLQQHRTSATAAAGAKPVPRMDRVSKRRSLRRRGSHEGEPIEPFAPVWTLQPQDLVITLLGTYVRPNPREVWSGGVVHLLEQFGFTAGAARVALSRLARRGLLARAKEGRLVYYTLSERAEHLLEEGDRRIFPLGTHEDWDGTWTLLWHSIPEEQRVERGRLARRLRFLGFGSMQDSTWIAPRDREQDVSDLLHDLGVERYAGVFVGRPSKDIHLEPLVSRAWNLEQLASRYAAFTAEFAPYRQAAVRRGMSDREAFVVRTRVIHWFRRFPFVDPEFPDEMMPRARHRREAVAVFHDVYDGLAEPAQRYFDAVTMPPGRQRAGTAAEQTRRALSR